MYYLSICLFDQSVCGCCEYCTPHFIVDSETDSQLCQIELRECGEHEQGMHFSGELFCS